MLGFPVANCVKFIGRPNFESWRYSRVYELKSNTQRLLIDLENIDVYISCFVSDPPTRLSL